MYSSIYPQPAIINNVHLTQQQTKASTAQIKFPEDVQVILRNDRQDCGNLYLGNIQAAENASIIESLKINALMCVAKGNATKHSKELIKHTKYIPLEQDQDVQIGQYLGEGVNFINQKLKIGNVMVHCVAGTNRSACFIIAFLMKHRNLSLEDAYNQVKSRRKVISPSDNMLIQLKQYKKGVSLKKSDEKLQKSIRYDQPSLKINSANDRSIRIKTNNVMDMDRSNFLAVDQQINIGSSRLSKTNGKMDDRDERRSCRSNKSYNSRISNNNMQSIINESKIMKNPQESFISQHSKPPTILNKSFTSYKSQSQRNHSHALQFNDLPQLRLQKKSSSSREQFTQKIRELDTKNSVINQKINMIQQRFQNENQNSRLNMEAQLNEISQLRISMYSERKNRLSRIAQENPTVEYVPMHTTDM